MRKSGFAGMAALACVALAVPVFPATAENNGQVHRHAQAAAAAPVARIIIGLRAEAGTPRIQAAGSDRIQALAQRTGLHFRSDREIGPTMRVVELDSPLSGAALERTLTLLESDPGVAFAEPDGRVYRHAVPVDPLFANQWYLQDQEISALNATSAWDLTTGSPGSVVAVLDTGVRFDHPDLLQAGRGGRLLPGFDFVGPDSVGGFRVANDGDGWDANPADPGDWVSASDAQSSLFVGCDISSSSWHGTRVSGLIGAIANNGEGISGLTWGTWILPVRVLGKCFGNNSDIMQGMRWAAGLHVAGVLDNPYPAKILNMSLGASGSCTAGYQTVVNEVAAAGVLVVASVGNGNTLGGGPVEYPANCSGVAGVGGIRHAGTKVGYSDLGPQITVAAPAGNCVNTAPGTPCLFSLVTASNTGATVAVASTYTNQFDFNVGTSFSAPLVAGIAGLMHGVNGNLSSSQLIARLREGTRPFPPAGGVVMCHVPVNTSDRQLECACTTNTCGAGMADATASVTAALRPIAAVTVPASVMAGQIVVLDGSGGGAACTRNVASYEWTVVSGNPPPTITGADTAVASVVAPNSGSFTVRLTVTDDQGAQDSADVTVTSSAAVTSAPAGAGSNACPGMITPPDPGPFVDDGPVPAAVPSGGGGGGGFGLAEILLLALGVTVSRRHRRSQA